MRFTIPEGNPTAVLDRAEGQVYHLTNQPEAASLAELLNTMHGRILSLDVQTDSSHTFQIEMSSPENNDEHY